MRAGRTIAAMTTSTDQRMVEEFMAGTDVPTIAARYAVPEEYVDRIIEQASYAKPRRWDFSLSRWGNRIVYALLAGWVVSFATGHATGINGIGWVIAVVLFVLTTTIVEVSRRH